MKATVWSRIKKVIYGTSRNTQNAWSGILCAIAFHEKAGRSHVASLGFFLGQGRRTTIAVREKWADAVIHPPFQVGANGL
jgi:tRNA(Arg) A34 adenosine deaminase TadA